MRIIVHGPCRSLTLQAKCVKNIILTKHFPKPYIEVISVIDDDYSNYRRRSIEHGGQIVTKINKGTP